MIVIFNGPPGSGKDEAANYFVENCGCEHLSFKDVLFEETFKYFDVDREWFMNDYYTNRALKEQPSVFLGGYSRREALIYVSEKYIKPKYGADFFGVQVANSIKKGMDYAISDGGFVEELIPLINKVGTNGIRLVQLVRKGCTYSSDSRRYFNGNLHKEIALGEKTQIDEQYVLPRRFDIKTYRVHNNGTLDNFHSALKSIYVEEQDEQRTTYHRTQAEERVPQSEAIS